MNYQLNETNSKNLFESLKVLVPEKVNKIYLYNNSLKDVSLAKLFLALPEGIQGLGVINNMIG